MRSDGLPFVFKEKNLISYRLNAIVNMVPKADTVADIGTDHGKVAADIIKKGKARRVICSDISGKSLDKARKLVRSKKLEDFITFREGDGLSVLEPGEADTAVIAGMGGELIADMLKKGGSRVPEILVLSCNTASGLLREWLCKNGFVIEDEELVFENRHFYPVMLVKKGEAEELGEMELEFGPVLLKKKPKILKVYLNRRIETTLEIRKKLGKANSKNKDELLRQIDERLGMYREVEKCLQQ